VVLRKLQAMNQSTNFLYLSRILNGINSCNGRSIVHLCGTAYLKARQLFRMYNTESFDEVQIINLKEHLV
jgi:hypothetical protein